MPAAARLGGRSRAAVRPASACLVGGLLAATALPPVFFLPGLLGFALLAWALEGARRPRAAFLAGTLFGFAYFAAGLYWIAIAFFVDAERFGALAIPAVAGLALLLGSTFGVAALLLHCLALRSFGARLVGLAVAWTLGELIRGPLLLDFPWNPVAVVWTATDTTMQAVAFAGVTGLGLLTVLAAAAPASLLRRGPARRRWPALAALALPLLLLAAGELRLRLIPAPPATGIGLRLVQADIPQTLKWDPQLVQRWFERHLAMSASASASASAAVPPARVLVWPEAAVPYQVEAEPVVRDLIARLLPPDGAALVGGTSFDPATDTAHNSLFALDAAGTVRARYDKVDLVPFGEYLPFRRLMAALGLEKLTPGAGDFVPGPGRETLGVAGLPPFSPLICYEAIFADRAARAAPRPAWLLNVTNDAWFGDSSGPYQHLAMARLRAVEEGLPLVRAANDGISVVTDAFGRVTARLPLSTAGVLDATLPGPLPGASVGRRLGWLLPAGIVFGCILAAVWLEAGHRRGAG